MNSRLKINKIITSLLQDKNSLTKTIPHHHEDKKFIQQICYGVARWHTQLSFIANKLLKKPIKTKDLNIFVIILTGLYEIIFMRTPLHAAICENVNIARQLKKEWACNLINAILRNFARNQESITDEINKNIAAKLSHPKWMIKKVQNAYPKNWETILAANNTHPPMSLRINAQKTSAKDYVKKINGKENSVCPSCVTLEKPCQINDIPGFNDGEVSVQDCGAQLATSLLDLQPKQLVLDACAAPGGKSMHILETEPNIEKLIALDHDKNRLKMITENLRRLKLSAQKLEIICADAGNLNTWWKNKKLFDRILLDAPCSATGVIRRHPDIKILKKQNDIKKLAATQLLILKNIWQTLKPNGILVYVTCSILPTENDEVIEKFITTTSDACIKKISTNWGTSTKYGKQILPGQNNMDGFYYAVICKTPFPP